MSDSLEYLKKHFPDFKWVIGIDKFQGVSSNFRIDVSERTCIRCGIEIYLLGNRPVQRIYQAEAEAVTIATFRIKVFLKQLSSAMQTPEIVNALNVDSGSN